jgi:hypothetical protein
MRRGSAVVALLALVVTGTVRAEDLAPAAGPFFGVHAGFGVPRGDIARSGPPVREVMEHKVPLGIDLGYRFNRWVWGELFFDLGPGSAASALCARDTSCSASDFRLGVAVLFRLAPRALLDPWLGVGIGIEVLNAKGFDATTGARLEWSWFGYELPFVEAGVDVAVSDRISVGPWGSLTLARFTKESIKPSGGTTVSGSIDDRATHRWLSAGLKATLRL